MATLNSDADSSQPKRAVSPQKNSLSRLPESTVNTSSEMASNINFFSTLPNEILERIILHHLRLHDAQFSNWQLQPPKIPTRNHHMGHVWQTLRQLDRRFLLLVDDMAERLEEVARMLCQGGGMPRNVLFEAAKHRRLDELSCRQLWGRWRRLEGIRNSSSSQAREAMKLPSNVRALRHMGDIIFVALDNGEMLWMDADSSKVLHSSFETYPVDQVRCLRVNCMEAAPLVISGKVINITCDLIVTLAQNRVSTHFIKADHTASRGFRITKSSLVTLPAGETVNIFTYRNFLYVSFSRRELMWKFSSRNVATNVTDYWESPYPPKGHTFVWMWPNGSRWTSAVRLSTATIYIDGKGNSADFRGSANAAADLTLADLTNRRPVLCSSNRHGDDSAPTAAAYSVEKTFFFHDDICVLLTGCKRVIIGTLVQYQPQSGMRFFYYDMLSIWHSVVTTVYMSMNVLFVGTERGEIFAYRVKGVVREWDLNAWDWRTKTGEESPIVDMELVQTSGNNGLSLIFASDDRIYTKLFI